MTSRLDTSDPALKEIVAKVRSDTDPASWCVLGYEGKAKIILKNSGSGSFMGAMEELEDGAVNYCLLRVEGGRDQESKSVKFVSVVWVGPSVGGMQKGRVGAHKADILEPILGWTVVDMQVDDMDDLTEAKITEMLKKASGANYDLGSNAGGNYKGQGSASIQQQARDKYKALEKDSNIGPVVFEKYEKPKEYAPSQRAAALMHARTHAHKRGSGEEKSEGIVHLEALPLTNNSSSPSFD